MPTNVSEKPDIVVNQRFDHPEGIVWDARRNRLLWVDIFKGQILSFKINENTLETLEVGQIVGSVAPRRDNGLVCAVREGFGLLSENGEFTLISSPLKDKPYLQMNDSGVDAAGRLWCGSMTFEFATRPGAGALYRLSADHQVSTQLEGVSISNGIAWSPDSKFCYYVDSATHRIDVFDFDNDNGTLGRRRTLATVKSLPDGIAVDVEGCIWVALFQGWEVRRYTPNGKVDRVIALPGSQVTTCTFGGERLDTLFIAVSPLGMNEEAIRNEVTGYIFAVNPGVQGLPTHEFLG